MLLRPQFKDFQIIGHYLGKIIVGFGFLMIIPAIIGLASREINPTLDFIIGSLATIITGIILTKVFATDAEIDWIHGMAVISASWLAAMATGAIPLYLSGHYKTYLDACFEVMSGLTTTGLTLVLDLDHLSYAHNFWRHFGPFIGGQGIAIAALALFIKSSAGAFKLYVGEARDEKLLPNVVHTARFIWIISFIYLIAGTLTLAIAGLSLGMKPYNAFFHGACIFMAGFDTAGFTPQTQNVLYYHSFVYELITIIIMIMGAFNFNLHYQIWSGRKKEIFKNIETRTFLLSIVFLFFLVVIGLNKLNVYPGALNLFRKGFFQLISAHTTTGFVTIYARQFISEWQDLGMFVLILAMALGGCICSTAGGIKMLRIGVALKALREDMKRLVLPSHAVTAQKFHHIKDVFLEDKTARAALIITLSYICIYIIGALVGMFFGYSFLDSLFESTSAAANVGLSCGITAPSMPVALKITYIVQMWAGRLEFMAVFALIGIFVAAVKGK